MAPFFFASLCVIPRKEKDDAGSIIVSPDTIYFDSEFVAQKTRPEISFYLIHGVYHILMMHHIRRAGRDPVKWNLACDVFINSCIYESFKIKPGQEKPVTGPGGETAFLKMPEDEPFIDDIDIKTDTPEMIYYWFDSDDESDTGKKLKKLRAAGNGRLDLVDDEKSREETEVMKQRSALRLRKKIETVYDQIRPTDAARGKGNSAEKISGEIEGVNLIDWRVVLRSKLTALEKDEKSLSHPDRRFAYRGMYVEGPVIEEDALTDVKVCIDTSGSMTDEEILSALYQIKNILKQYRTTSELVFWDEEVHSAGPFENLHQLKLAEKKTTGRGGTNPDCLFEYFSGSQYKGERPRLLLIFTDGYFELPDRKYAREFGNETIWVIITEKNTRWMHEAPAFGKTVYMKKPGDYRKMIRERLGNISKDTEQDKGNYPGDYLTE